MPCDQGETDDWTSRGSDRRGVSGRSLLKQTDSDTGLSRDGKSKESWVTLPVSQYSPVSGRDPDQGLEEGARKTGTWRSVLPWDPILPGRRWSHGFGTKVKVGLHDRDSEEGP